MNDLFKIEVNLRQLEILLPWLKGDKELTLYNPPNHFVKEFVLVPMETKNGLVNLKLYSFSGLGEREILNEILINPMNGKIIGDKLNNTFKE